MFFILITSRAFFKFLVLEFIGLFLVLKICASQFWSWMFWRSILASHLLSHSPLFFHAPLSPPLLLIIPKRTMAPTRNRSKPKGKKIATKKKTTVDSSPPTKRKTRSASKADEKHQSPPSNDTPISAMPVKQTKHLKVKVKANKKVLPEPLEVDLEEVESEDEDEEENSDIKSASSPRKSDPGDTIGFAITGEVVRGRKVHKAHSDVVNELKPTSLMPQVVLNKAAKTLYIGVHPSWFVEDADVKVKFVCVCCGKEMSPNTFPKHKDCPQFFAGKKKPAPTSNVKSLRVSVKCLQSLSDRKGETDSMLEGVDQGIGGGCSLGY